MLRAWDAQVVAYSFGDVELDTTTYELRRAGRRVPLEPQAFDVLTYLVQHRERVVPKEELMDQVWGGRFVSESAVTSRIKQARRAIGDTGEAQRLIRTVHGRGYHFVAAVTDTASDGGSRLGEPIRVRQSSQEPTGGGRDHRFATPRATAWPSPTR